jgi:hypothetical protein
MANQTTGTGGTHGTGGADLGSDGSAQTLDASDQSMADALLSPVPEAAAATPPTVATESCSVQSQAVAGVSYLYAVHAFPGKTKTDLAALRVVGHIIESVPLLPGYEDTANVPVYVKDGEAAVHCGTVDKTTDAFFDKVTFILP